MKIVRSKLNEDFSSAFQKGKSFLQGIFKKIGKFFVAFYNDEVIPVVLPINIGIAYKQNMLPKGVVYYPSADDLKLDGSLKRNENLKNIRESVTKTFKRPMNEAKISLEHPDKDVVNINAIALMKKIRIIVSNPKAKPLMIWGAPGIGKTQIVSQVLQASGGGRIIDIQTAKMAPDDWFLPAINKETMEAYDIPKSWLPVYKESDDPEENAKRNDKANGKDGKGGVIFLDELSRASGSVQNTCLKLVDERRVGEYVLGDKWSIISASNRADDDPDSVQNFSKALGNRFTQVNYVPDFYSWKNWAEKALVDPRIVSFLEFNQEYLYTMETNSEQSIFASPRSWEAASKNLKLALEDAKQHNEHLSDKDMEDIVSSDVGKAAGIQFMAFLKLLSRYSQEDIKEIFTSPEKAKMPPKKGEGFEQAESSALVAVACTSTKDRTLTPKELENFVKYLIKLNNASLAIRGFKFMFDIHPDMHMELGEVAGHDKYKKAYEMLVEKYGDVL